MAKQLILKLKKQLNFKLSKKKLQAYIDKLLKYQEELGLRLAIMPLSSNDRQRDIKSETKETTNMFKAHKRAGRSCC